MAEHLVCIVVWFEAKQKEHWLLVTSAHDEPSLRVVPWYGFRVKVESSSGTSLMSVRGLSFGILGFLRWGVIVVSFFSWPMFTSFLPWLVFGQRGRGFTESWWRTLKGSGVLLPSG